ncbi:MAG: MarR family transcriptional regulator [Sphingomonas sp. 28-66-16]|nr:MAG: MarR family transcriptional regulator [Sphingomonas sp. 28-66-16]
MNEGKELQRLLGFQLLMAELHMGNHARAALAPFGITPAKLAALLIVRDNPGCDQTALGQALHVNRSSAMKLVNALTERDLVERQPGRDLRTNALHITAGGRDRIDEMVRCLDEADQAAAVALSTDERLQLMALLRKIRTVRD